MLLGHGALIRRAAWVGGFPELVSEDLAFALRIREKGWRGAFAEDVWGSPSAGSRSSACRPCCSAAASL